MTTQASLTQSAAPRASSWRSMLFVPVLNQRFLEKARERGADAIQLDLEDSIPQPQKEEAGRAVQSAAAALAAQGIDVVVRINRAWRQAVPDLTACICPSVKAITLPKVPNAAHIHAIAEIVDELESERSIPVGTTRLVAMIETAEGVANIDEIAMSNQRVCGLTVGAEDLAVDLGGRPCNDMLLSANWRAVIAARRAGIQPIGYVGTVADFADQAAFAARIDQARDMGFTGGFCIHPSQVAILNRGFSPQAAEVAWAEGVIDAYRAALREGKGAATYNGAMIDKPVADRAERILLRHQSLTAQHAS